MNFSISKLLKPFVLGLTIALSGCAEVSVTTLTGSCDARCVVQRKVIDEPRRYVSKRAQGAILRTYLAASARVAISGSDDRAKAAAIDGILGVGVGYTVGQNISNNRLQATELARELSNELRVLSVTTRKASLAFKYITTDRKIRISRGQSNISAEAIGFKEDLEIVTASLDALERQLISSNEFKRALVERNVRVSSLNSSLEAFDDHISALASTIDRERYIFEQEFAQEASCAGVDGKEEDTGGLGDFPLPGCRPLNG